MDILEKVMEEIYENKEHYKEGDYIQLCKELKDCYNQIKGIPVNKYDGKGMDSADDDDEIIFEFQFMSGYSDQYIPDYAGDYLDAY